MTFSLRSELHTSRSCICWRVICNMVWCLVACDVEISKFLCGLTNTTHTLNCHQISLSANYCKFFSSPLSPSNASGAFSVICILHHWPGTKVVAIEEIAQAIGNRRPLRITKNSGTSYMWRICQQYWFGERASVVTFRIAQNSAQSWWWWCIQYVSSIQPSSIRYAWGVLWKFVQGFCELINHCPVTTSPVSSLLRLHTPTKCEEEELSWQSSNLCSRNLIGLSPFPSLIASFIELYSFNHATVFIRFFVQWASEEIEEV